jgi:hypothetical protein
MEIQQLPEAHGPPARSRSAIQIVAVVGLAGCGCLVLVAAGIAAMAFVVSSGPPQLAPVVEQHLQLVHQRAYQEAYDTAGQEYRDAMTLEDFRDLCDLVNETLGEPGPLSVESWEVKSWAGSGTAVATFTSDYSRGPVTLRATLRMEGGLWRIIGLRYDSPLFYETRPCPSCGHGVKARDRFCRECGAELPEAEPTESEPR